MFHAILFKISMDVTVMAKLTNTNMVLVKPIMARMVRFKPTTSIVHGGVFSLLLFFQQLGNKKGLLPYMQKAGDCGDISPQIFLDFPQNFRLRTRNQYCTQAIA